MRKLGICLLTVSLCAAFAFAEPDNGWLLPRAEVPQFDNLFFKHLGYTFNRGAKAFVAGYVGGSNHAPSLQNGAH